MIIPAASEQEPGSATQQLTAPSHGPPDWEGPLPLQGGKENAFQRKLGMGVGALCLPLQLMQGLCVCVGGRAGGRGEGVFCFVCFFSRAVSKELAPLSMWEKTHGWCQAQATSNKARPSIQGRFLPFLPETGAWGL